MEIFAMVVFVLSVGTAVAVGAMVVKHWLTH
jgi:hypothetical protein